MSEFKGTKEPLEVRGNKIFVKGSCRQIATISVIDNYEPITFKPKEDTEANANALLFSKAPELLGMAIKLVKRLEENNLGELWAVKMAKELIKESTEL